MKRTSLLLVILPLLLLLDSSICSGEGSGPTNGISIELRDGSVLNGTVISKSAKSITVRTSTGDQVVSTDQLSSNSIADLKLSPVDDPANLKKKTTELESNNRVLEAENQQLKRQLTPSPAGTGVTTAPVIIRGSPGPSAPTGFWLCTNTGKRHNLSCRYYMNCKGRPCVSNEGIPCKICGG